MPSPIGHLLAGVAIGWLAERHTTTGPGSDDARNPVPLWSGLVLTCAVLAALPDLDLLYPPIHRRVTHGVGAVLLIMIVAKVVTGWVTPRNVWRVTLVCGLAYGSHILLDLLGRDASPPYGVRALWPFTDAWYISGWDVFPGTERRQLFSRATIVTNLRSILIEIAILGPVAAAAWWTRRVQYR